MESTIMLDGSNDIQAEYYPYRKGFAVDIVIGDLTIQMYVDDALKLRDEMIKVCNQDNKFRNK